MYDFTISLGILLSGLYLVYRFFSLVLFKIRQSGIEREAFYLLGEKESLINEMTERMDEEMLKCEEQGNFFNKVLIETRIKTEYADRLQAWRDRAKTYNRKSWLSMDDHATRYL